MKYESSISTRSFGNSSHVNPCRSLRQEQALLPQPQLFSNEQLQAWMDEDEEAMRRFRAGA